MNKLLVTQLMFVHWFTWIILLAFYILKKNIRSIYIWNLIGLPSSSIMLSTRSVNCFPRRLNFLATLFQLLVSVLFSPRLMLSNIVHSQYISKTYRTFLWFADYYQQFVKGFAQIAIPLTNLTCKSQDFAWSKACKQAFRTLKQWLTENPIIQVYDDSLPIGIQIDVSDFAIRATLVQQCPKSKVQLLVEYLSHWLSQTESWYSAIE